MLTLPVCISLWHAQACGPMYVYPCSHGHMWEGGECIPPLCMFSDARLACLVILSPSSCLTIILSQVFWIQTLPREWPSCACVLVATGCYDIWWDVKSSRSICSHSFVRQLPVAKRRLCSHLALPASSLHFPVVPTVQCVGLLLTCLLFQSCWASAKELVIEMRNKWKTKSKEDGVQM